MIKTERCDVKKLNRNDLEFYKMLKSNSSVRKYLWWVWDIRNIHIKFEKLLWEEELNFIVFDSVTEEALWIIYIDTYYNWVDKELSYEFTDSNWWKWFAYETIIVIIDYIQCNLGIDILFAETQSNNQPSLKLLEKLGFLFQEEIVRHWENQKVYKYSV